jgi:MFS transporter, UMF1 family
MTPPADFVPPRSSTRAWIVYDLANTIFALGVVGLYLPAWLTSEGLPDSSLAIVQSTAGVIVVLAAPWIGARTDHLGRRLPTLTGTTLVAVAATALLTTVPPMATLVLLGVALVSVSTGSVVYDAMLPDVSIPSQRGRVSGIGVGVGYLGSLLGLGIGVLTLDVLGLGFPATFAMLAAGFLVFAIPTFLFVREPERPRRPGRPPALRSVVGGLVAAWRRAAGHEAVVRFLLGRFLYSDAINTLIGGFLTIYVIEELGMDLGSSRNLLGLAILAAMAGGFGGGAIVQRIGATASLRLMLVMWLVAIAAGVAAGATDRTELAWIIGPVGGFALGGTWASDRVVMSGLSPPAHLGELYGLYATVSRFATILGPLAWGLIVDVLGWGRQAAMASLAIFVLAALVVLRHVPEVGTGQYGARPASADSRRSSTA